MSLRCYPPMGTLTLQGLFALQFVAAIVLALGAAEVYLRAHYDSGVIFPRYAYVKTAGIRIWFDLGLFTDPPLAWPFSRVAVIFAIGCAVYMGWSSITARILQAKGAYRSPDEDGFTFLVFTGLECASEA